MQETTSIDLAAEELFRELRKTTPSASLGFPSPEELQRRRNERLESERSRLLHRQEAEDREFQRLKEAALSRIRKDRPRKPPQTLTPRPTSAWFNCS